MSDTGMKRQPLANPLVTAESLDHISASSHPNSPSICRLNPHKTLLHIINNTIFHVIYQI